MQNDASLWEIFVAFFRANIVGYGGGPATIPLIEKEVVSNHGWMTGEQFANALAVGNTLPGPIATKMAGYVGYFVGGWAGAVTALVASVGPTVVAMIGLYGLLTQFRDHPWVSGMIQGVRPVIWTLFLLLAVDYVRFVASWPTALIAVLAFVMVYFLQLHPALAVVMGLGVGAAFFR